MGLRLLDAVADVEPLIIGWTGWPGAGKSSLIARVVSLRRADSPASRIAVLAVDPSSSTTGGSLLGDRIRMDELALDSGVYIRSLASRGGGGALAPAVIRIARFLAGAGFSEIHIETVGAGQSDVLIRSFSDVAILVVPPHAGDVIQGLKAGIVEIADLFIVSKSDLDGAAAAGAALECALQTGLEPGGQEVIPRILLASAKESRGITEVVRAVDERLLLCGNDSETRSRRSRRRAAEFRAHVAADAIRIIEKRKEFAETEARVVSGECAPWRAAEEILREIAGAGRGGEE